MPDSKTKDQGLLAQYPPPPASMNDRRNTTFCMAELTNSHPAPETVARDKGCVEASADLWFYLRGGFDSGFQGTCIRVQGLGCEGVGLRIRVLGLGFWSRLTSLRLLLV